MISDNDDSNNTNQESGSSKRTVVSFQKKKSIGSAIGGGGRTHISKTIEVEVKRRKASNLMVDLTGQSSASTNSEKRAVEPTDAAAQLNIISSADSEISSKLTNQEFQRRFQVLQDALKNEEKSASKVDDELAYSYEEVVREEMVREEVVREEIVRKEVVREEVVREEMVREEYFEEESTTIISEAVVYEEVSVSVVEEQELPGPEDRHLPPQAKAYTRKQKQVHVTSGETVVFKSSEYVKKQPAKPKSKEAAATKSKEAPAAHQPKSKVTKPQSSSASSLATGISNVPLPQQQQPLHSNRSKRSVDPEEKKAFRSSPGKKEYSGKKISRVIIERALDNDLEERVRSVASFKRARSKQKGEQRREESAKIIREVSIPDVITVSELANRMAVRGADVIKYLMKIGTFATLNQSIDGDTAEVICSEFGHTPKRISESDVENEIEMIVDIPEDLLPRAPIVAVMGHVDHGKTTLLDALRKTNVAAREAGGITQHVSSYQVQAEDGRKITFIDTPGHAAFSKIRSIGAVITDIIVLVVAADDGIKEQTLEAIAHARAYEVPIIVAINKIDKSDVNIGRIKSELMAQEILLEEYGGDVLSAEISALKGQNLSGLIDAILLQAEMMQLQANPNRKAVGMVVESCVSKGKGIIANAIIQNGTLYPGDILVAGGAYGKVKMLYNEYGEKIKKAGPSVPVEIVGFNSSPSPGDTIHVMDSEQKAREVAEYRQRVRKEKSLLTETATIEQMMAGHAASKIELNILAKADVYGSLEALILSIKAVTHDEIDVKVTERGVGMINESDIDFAKHTKSLVVGFNVGTSAAAKENAKVNNVKIYHSNIIYHIVEEVKSVMSALLPPVIEENYIGRAEVRKIFTIARYGTIAGCYVSDGLIKKSDSKIKVFRNGTCIFEGKIRSMKHEKDEIKESKQNHECGILVEGYNDFAENDYIECYEIVQKTRTIT
ncbi:MAG: translation initiation factor IF-2 [Holosporales bacterium]|jgi:translation initiation factor IF-2|nr:translation initiation factor IF-2 [Holosporales bacterium]